MRESQKMSLDYKLHTKIIESIIKIQRWFKTRLQKSKYAVYRQAAINIQSVWRMHSAQKQLADLKLRTNAALIIQSAFRMFRQRKTYNKLRRGTILVQAHARGKLARKRFQKMYRQKLMKDRYRLRSTQSLPIEPAVDTDVQGGDINRSYSKLARNTLDLDDNNITYGPENRQYKQNTPIDILSHRAQNLMLSSGSNDEELASRQRIHKPNSMEEQSKGSVESVDSRSVRTYNLEHASKQSLDENLIAKR